MHGCRWKRLRRASMSCAPCPWRRRLKNANRFVELVAETGLKYMMAETVVYSREFLFIKELYEKGDLGKIQYMAASHPQDMDGWPEYWERMIPMHYATHVVSPVLGLVNGRAEYVSCFGSGTVRDSIAQKSGNRFAVEIVAISRSPTVISRPTFGDSSTIQRVSIGKALTFTALRNPSNGHWSKANLM